jgi:two-component system, chemotaxis family, sensor kinase CheA
MSKETDNIDLKRFNQVFFEECAEHLAEMERILLAISNQQPDQEELNAIFRAAHSIKGGAGIFGFEDMTIVTHVMESLLDRVRKQETELTTPMVDLFLEAADVISMQLAGHREGTPVNEQAVDEVRRRLQQLIETSPTAGSTPAGAPAAPAAPLAAACAPQEGEVVRRYRLDFTPETNIFRRGIRVESILTELSELAEPDSFSNRAELIECPEFATFDPEGCITRWHFELSTLASPEQIMDVFMFVADDEQLLLQEIPAAAGADGQLVPAASPPQVAQLTASSETEAVLDSARDGRRLYDRDEVAPTAYGRRNSEADSSIRVNVTKVDQLINQVGELLITQAMLAQTAAELDPVRFENLHKSLGQLARNSRDLQGSVMSIRLVPISIVFSRFPRLVREMAGRLGKSVQLKTVGDTTELDKGLIEKIADPLSHLVRNSLDHGMETSEVRSARGKDPVGTIQLKASQVGGRIVIEVSDDGAGLNREKILAKASQAGLSCHETMSDDEVWQLIFQPGFSTAEEVTDLSGRGVGMDVVLKNVQSIGGRVQLSSQFGKGVCVTISLPLTLAILNGLSVAVADEKFIIPLNAIIESLQPRPEQLKTVNGRQLVAVRGEYLPIIRLHELFGIDGASSEPERAILVLVDLDGEKAALLVDALLDEQQVVVKSVETNYRKVDGSAGATILGDGRVALILDVSELFALQKKHTGNDPERFKEAS